MVRIYARLFDQFMELVFGYLFDAWFKEAQSSLTFLTLKLMPLFVQLQLHRISGSRHIQ